MEIIQLDSIKAYNDLYGLPTFHPLITVVDMNKARKTVNHVKMNYGIYALFIKHGVNCTLRYGRQKYDYQKGTVVSFAPGQTVQVDIIDEEQPVDVTGLIFHPDLIYGTPLAERMERYTFFNYAQSEALHLSDREQELLAGCLHNIEAETEHPVDTHSRELLCTHIELFLEYCLRFYDRQFCTRSKVNSDVLHKFEHELNDYFRSGSAQRQGLPSVRYFADKACLSPSYFGDYTYGYKKGTVLISLLNAIILLVAVGAIIVESIHKFSNPVPVNGAVVSWTAGAGIIVNGVSAWLLMRKRKSDLNAEGAFLHMAADTLVSIGVVVSGIAMSFTGWYIIDPVISLVIVGVILASTWHLLSQSLRLSLDGIPEGVDPERIMNEIKSVAGVEDIHHLHIWAISTSEVAMTAHVVIDDIAKMEQIKHEIHHRMSQDGISHSTLEFEHHGETCDSPGNGWTSC